MATLKLKKKVSIAVKDEPKKQAVKKIKGKAPDPNSKNQRNKALKAARKLIKDHNKALRESLAAAWEWVERYPIFDNEHPLAVGIAVQLCDDFDLERDNLEFEKSDLKRCLRNYCRSTWYQVALTNMVQRIRIDGSLVSDDYDYLTGIKKPLEN